MNFCQKCLVALLLSQHHLRGTEQGRQLRQIIIKNKKETEEDIIAKDSIENGFVVDM